MFNLVASATVLHYVNVSRETSDKMTYDPRPPCGVSAIAPLLLRSGKICTIAAVDIPSRRIMFHLNVIDYE